MLAMHCTQLPLLNKTGTDTVSLNMLTLLPLRFLLPASEVPSSLLLFNEAEVLSPLHVSSGLPLSSKGITKLIIEEKMWCILLLYYSSFTSVGTFRIWRQLKLLYISVPNDNTCTAVGLGFIRRRYQNLGQVWYMKKSPVWVKIQ